jgi:COMPASS component SWD3
MALGATEPVEAAVSTSGRLSFDCERVLTGHSLAVSSVKFAPLGSHVATASADHTLGVWNLDSGERQATLSGHEAGVSDVAWNPNGRYLASAGDDKTLRLWDVETGACLRTLTGHTNYVFCCNFGGPSGNLLASGSFDETMRLWDVRQGRCLREVPAHSDPITAVSFTYDGTMIVTSSLDGLIRLWDTQVWCRQGRCGAPPSPSPPAAPLQLACSPKVSQRSPPRQLG